MYMKLGWSMLSLSLVSLSFFMQISAVYLCRCMLTTLTVTAIYTHFLGVGDSYSLVHEQHVFFVVGEK